MTESILQNCKGVEEYPFPHINIKNALSQEYYDELYQALPSWETINRNDIKVSKSKNNKRRNLVSDDILKNEAEVWKDFVRHHTSTEFYHEFLYWFGDYIREYLPEIEQKYGKLENISIERKSRHQRGAALLQQCGICINTPVTQKSSVRGAHIDGLTKLSANLFYMADPNDDAGGNLDLYECKGKRIETSKEIGKMNIMYESQKVAVSIPYEPNRFVSFFTTPKAVHGVSVREKNALPRRFVSCSISFNPKPKQLRRK